MRGQVLALALASIGLAQGMTAMSAAAEKGEPARAVTPVASVDLEKYAGVWHEIARYPNRFQRRCAGDVTATYTRLSDGRVRVVNRCRTETGGTIEAEGVARVVAGSGNARLEVRFAPAWLGFLPFVWGDYWVIGLADDYRWAVVGTPDRKYLWVLARSASMTDGDWESAVARARENGFDAARLVRTGSSAGGS